MTPFSVDGCASCNIRLSLHRKRAVLAGGGTNFSIANALGTGRSDLFQAGAYVRHTVGPAYV